MYRILLILLAGLTASACNTPYDTEPPDNPGDFEGLSVLVFTKIAGFRHPSIKVGVPAIEKLGQQNGWRVIATENGAAFNAEFLSKMDVVVWLNNTWDVLNPDQESAFSSWMEAGGGYVGLHAAADCEYDWPWYGEMLGTWFNDHPNFPNVRTADVVIEAPDHPTMSGLPARWTRDDEWYNYHSNPRDADHITVLASLDETSYDAGSGAMGDHPIIWSGEVGSGRLFYSGLGHTEESFSDPAFLGMLASAIEWTANEEQP